MPPFNAAEALMIGAFFGSCITWLLATEYHARKMIQLIDRIGEKLEQGE